MVETIRLESGHTLTGIGGSNPSLSASFGALVSNYLSWADTNLAAPTAYGYRHIWNHYWRDDLAHLEVGDVTTVLLSTLLTKMVERGLGTGQMRHNKWMLSPSGRLPARTDGWPCCR